MIILNRGSFDVIVGMDLFFIQEEFCDSRSEKVVSNTIEVIEYFGFLDERTQGVVKTLVNTKVDEPKLSDISITRVSYDLVIFCEEHQCRLLRREAWSSFEVSVGITEEGEVSNVKDKILATSSETSKVENAPAQMLHDLDQQMEKRADDGKANVVTDALSRKERVKPRRVRAMAMTIQYGVRGMILTA
ncbi:hypothetical protein Tco_1276353 [Tanacetum coccineum]